MTIAEMLGQSGVLTLLGMGIVFGFLLILIVVISQFGKFAGIKGRDPALVMAAGTPAGYTAPVQAAAASDARITAVITAAINKYKGENHV